MNKVSVIVPCYKLAQYLPEALDSVLAQSFRDWECIVVNDGSPDNTAEIIDEYCRKDSRFKALNLKNGGVIKARNEGVKLSHGDYLLFLDADDILMPDYLEKAASRMDADANVLIVTGPAEFFGEAKKSYKMVIPPFSRETMLGRNCIHISSLVRRSDFDRVGGFSPDMAAGLEDWDFWLGILEKDGEVVVLDTPAIRYRLRKDSRNKRIPDETLGTLRRNIWEHHKSLYSKHFPDPKASIEYQRLLFTCNKLRRFPGIRIYNALRKLI